MREKEGYKRHSKLFATPAFSIHPVQKPYGEQNLNNGVYRSAEWTNIWISKPGLPQSGTLFWEEPVDISRIEILFDTNLDYADQRYGFPRGRDDYSIPAVIKETVSDYEVVLKDASGKVLHSHSVEDNRYRKNNLLYPDTVKQVSSLEIVIKKTLGSAEARVFGIRVF